MGATLLVHGEAGVGKSFLGQSAPKPVLIADVEGRSRFLPGKKVYWNPQQAPPQYDGTWDTCIVMIEKFDQLNLIFQWLKSGQHPFKSFVLDSISEAQKRLVDAIAGQSAMKIQDYGTLLRQLEHFSRSCRDLTAEPASNIVMVVFLSGSMNDEGTMRPLLQGQLRLTLPYYTDCTGYLFMGQVGDASGMGVATVRQLLINPQTGVVAKDGTGGRLTGPIITNPDLTEMFNALQIDPAAA
jgi:hypothetical protein